MNKAEIMTKRHDKKCPQAPRLRFPEFRDEWHSQALGAIASIIKEKVGNKKCTLMSIMTGVGLRECPAYTLLYQFSPKDTGQSKVK